MKLKQAWGCKMKIAEQTEENWINSLNFS